jgi:hypothetical protein
MIMAVKQIMALRFKIRIIRKILSKGHDDSEALDGALLAIHGKPRYVTSDDQVNNGFSSPRSM